MLCRSWVASRAFQQLVCSQSAAQPADIAASLITSPSSFATSSFVRSAVSSPSSSCFCFSEHRALMSTHSHSCLASSSSSSSSSSSTSSLCSSNSSSSSLSSSSSSAILPASFSSSSFASSSSRTFVAAAKWRRGLLGSQCGAEDRGVATAARAFSTSQALNKEGEAKSAFDAVDPLAGLPKTSDFRPNPDGSPEISSRVLAIADAIQALNILEAHQLFQVLQVRWGIPEEALFGVAAPAGGAGGQGGAQEAEEEEKPKVEAAPAAPATFTIKLASFEDGAKFKVLKEIRTLKPGLSLAECKNLIDKLPSVLLENADKDTVSKWTEALAAVGAQVTAE